MKGKRIGIFGKGGAGKSTIAFLISQALQKRGYSVCVLDADSTNLGLHWVFDIQTPPKPLLDYFGGMVFNGGVVTCPVDDPTPLAEAEIDLENLDSSFYAISPSGILFLITGKIGDQGPGAGCDGPIAKIARDFRLFIQGQPPTTIVDFKAGFEDTARGVLNGFDLAIFVVDPTIVSIKMAANMKNIVRQIKAGVLPATSHLKNPELVHWANKLFSQARIKDIWFVLNKVQNKDEENFLYQKLKEEDIKPVGVIRQHDSISHAWLNGTPIKSDDAMREAHHILDKLESAINLNEQELG